MNGKRFFRFLRAVFVGVVCVLASALPASGAGSGKPLRAWVTSSVPLKHGAWTILNGRVNNPSDNTLNATLVVTAAVNSGVQFSSPVWAPPESKVQIPIPFFFEGKESAYQSMDLDVKLLAASSGPDTILSQDISSALNQGNDSPTGLCLSRDDDESTAVISRMRTTQNRKPRAIAMDARNVPTSAMALVGISEFILGSPDPLSPAQAMALREWVARGGDLWVMADRVDPQTPRLVLGDEWTCEKVGETELTSVTFVGGKTEPATEYDQPVRMLRMLSPGMEVTQTVDGWPAVMWRNVGRGLVLVTTVESRAFGRPVGREPFSYQFELMAGRFLAPVGKAGPESVSPRLIETQAAMHDMALSIVGHEVVHRAPVMIILAVLGGALFVIGWRLGARRRLELLAPAAVVLSVLATASMLLLGAMTQGSTPLTIASMQEARVASTTGPLMIDGVADIYSPSAFEGSLVAPPAGWVKPEMESQKGHLLRMRWAELERMRWDHVNFPGRATLKSTMAGRAILPENVSAVGTFGPDGFAGLLKGIAPGDQMETVIVATGGRLAPDVSADGHFVAGIGQELRPGETTHGAITPDRAHRIEAMQPWVKNKSRSDFTLFTWTRTLDSGVSVEHDGETKGERQVVSLVGVPLTIERPATSGTFTIPPAFIKVSSTRVKDLGGSTPLYDERNDSFLGKIPTGSNAALRFELPRQVLPVKVESYTLKIDMSAPDRDVKVFAVKTGKTGRQAVVTLTQEHGCNQPMELKINPGTELQPDSDGAVILGLEVSAVTDQASTWTLTNMTLTAQATTDTPPADGKPQPITSTLIR